MTDAEIEARLADCAHGGERTALYRAVAKLHKSGKIRIEDDTLALA